MSTDAAAAPPALAVPTATAMPPATATHGPVPQHLCLVLPTTAEFDSRTYRIARGVVERGHTVTVIGRRGDGLPDEEIHPAGYRIVRVSHDAVGGLPAQPVVRAIRRAQARLRGRAGAPSRPPTDTAAAEGTAALATSESPRTTATEPRGPRGRLVEAVLRRVRIQLSIRSQRTAARAVAPRADLFHGMAYMGIPIALDLARRQHARVVYDARDIYMDAANLARMRGPLKEMLRRSERGWARAADRVVTVNRPYAEVMAERFDVPLPLIVMNCSNALEGIRGERRFHAALGLRASTRVVLYQGGFARDRGVEQLIDAIREVDNAVLVLLGYGPLEAEFRAAAAASGGRVRILPAVAPSDLLAWVSSADVVAMPIQPTTLNHRLTTPNKLLEAMAAGVPVVVSDLPGMAPIVRATGCGRCCDPEDPASIAAAIREILDAAESDRDAWRAGAQAAVRDTFNWDSQLAVLLEEYGRLTGRPW